ncbi:alcohol dehydrogenase [Jatrophihabitans endophyticus]|uniref:Alcohol dehydrogenase n=1 Tax=Jatrophihabitans endophyticus TaxID=1206085 RepID=A0A1M5EK28_9ACTN|nr:zinc-binding dehydrogenase [Jatrophihabitans endophyticus]SHF79431.1 alcohol dehydrogenase [Jatrophihabitans endophyticus]
MRAVLVEAFGAAPQLRDVPEPACPADGAVIEVRATGLCRSDWHGWAGHDPDIALPHVPGHEFAGVVAAVGPDVRSVRVGSRVTVPFVCACGRCATCRAGAGQVCEDQYQPGFTGWGSFAERVAVPRADVNVVPLPDELTFATAAGLGCRFATAYRAVTAHGRVGPGDHVAVFGCGGVGLSAVQIAAARGAEVVAVDVSARALALAAEVGARHTIPAADAAARLAELTGGGAHVTIDALGDATILRTALAALRPRGRHVQVGLLVGADADTATPMATVIAKELELYGSHGMAAQDYPAMLAEIAAGRLRPDRVVTGEIGLAALAGADGALATMGDAPPTGAVVIDPARS